MVVVGSAQCSLLCPPCLWQGPVSPGLGRLIWQLGAIMGFLTLCLPEEHWSHALGTGSGLFPQWEMKIS